ncbi:hypothetical protein [Mycobacteroides salmoniphilum]|uniref:Uncharacterized protein n=1 Tax=Mycobacteroides salmoniphilum TaxID=404941 RepID=A0A4R8T079_9MYCO|nr:hypothetical protein [Mycobacteroides salmoniphilum]TEA09221.1 hypothetical protein CCUG60884_00211 [Mycobacteroides salmoniphilum]
MDDIPLLPRGLTGDGLQPDIDVRIAYWFGIRMHCYGWTLRSFTFAICAGRQVAKLVAVCPDGQVRTYRADRLIDDGDLPAMFVNAVRNLGAAGGHAPVMQLRALLHAVLSPAVQRRWAAAYRHQRRQPKPVGGKQYVPLSASFEQGRW